MVPPEAVAHAQAEFEHCEVWPEHWEAVMVFTRCDSQWITLLGLGGLHYQGLDYQRVACVAREWLGLTTSRHMLDQIRVMEHEAKQILNK